MQLECDDLIVLIAIVAIALILLERSTGLTSFLLPRTSNAGTAAIFTVILRACIS